MARVLLFAGARRIIGAGELTVDKTTLSTVINELKQLGGDDFVELLAYCSIMIDGTRHDGADDVAVGVDSEVAILPPVSGGCC